MADPCASADLLRRAGRWDEAAAVLEAALLDQRDLAVEVKYLAVQHSAFADVDVSRGPDTWPPEPPDEFAGVDSLPEIDAHELDAEMLSSALHHHGSLIVRGFMAAEHLDPLIGMIDRAFAAEASWEEDRAGDHAPWFVPFVPDKGYSLGEWERLFVTYGGGVHAVDVPPAWASMARALRSTGIGAVLSEYFGERPTLSAKKTTLRRALPDSRSGWHQDGAFLGDTTRSANVWTSLTDSGVDAPGLDVVHKRFDDILETGTEGAQFTWSVSPDVALAAGGNVLERPVFGAGDALLFDERTLHQTAVDPETMTKTRYAIESWFFAPSTYPSQQIPICF
jgi:hypothetical protein